MQSSLLEPASAAWRDTLARCRHDCHHTPGWHSAAERSDNGSAAAVLVTQGEHRLLVPLVRRPLAAGSWDASSAYGYAGPVLSSGAPAGFADAALAAGIALLRKHGCVSWFIRLHPLLNADWHSRLGQVVEHAGTVSVDLTKSAQRLWQETQARHKLGINRARRAGVTARLDRDFATLPRFIELYNHTMTRLDASPYYFFDAQYYRTLVRGLGDDLLLFVAEEGDCVIGSALFTVARGTGIMQYHLSGWDWDYRHRQPTKTLIHAAREWGRIHGMHYLHLGGGLGSSHDSLYEFKRGFSPDTHVFRTQRLVVDADRYVALSGGDRGTLARLDGFFPAYRRPGARFGPPLAQTCHEVAMSATAESRRTGT
ncbi:GNAT family N-acetyltransferase [Cupriavidus necator]|uniref:GNAT family N-acetyltransferase n=1 Tax=Cupriavidus necator TaxID=106590 RepID=UPI00339D46D7